MMLRLEQAFMANSYVKQHSQSFWELLYSKRDITDMLLTTNKKSWDQMAQVVGAIARSDNDGEASAP